jgi:tRNA-2-methylthio-N6-dimethylallyladenosine synthase
MSEIKGLIKKGYRQITLLGQNVNNYQSGQTNFTKLLEKIAKLPGNFRVFFITSHPKDFNRRIISLVARYPKLCPYFHLPVQSGSNRILKKMNRHYTREKYLQIIRAIRRRIPHAAITTDIIVGFPGETKTDFEQSARLCRTARFDQAYIARYSPRPGTTSAKLRDTVSLKEKKRRARVLTRIVEKTAREQNLRHMGHATQVLVETSHRKNGQFLNLGKNECSKSVIFKSTKEHWHQIVRVKLTKASVWGLYGQIFESRHLDN